MQKDFHYYATYAAAIIAGYPHEDSLDIAYSAQFVDLCSRTLLAKIKAPRSAASTQLQLELMDARTDLVGLQNITRIWSSFHFLPYDLYAEKKKCSLRYKNKYRLICRPNGALLEDTVKLAKGGSLQSIGIAMHVLADTWAHAYFAGTPSLVINNTDFHFFEILGDEGEESERPIAFRHNPSAPDDVETGQYSGSIRQSSENSIMNLGHGRAGHLPDYSYIRYKYMPAWGDYGVIVKDNPHDYFMAFCQMVYALKYLRDVNPDFERDTYDFEAVSPWEEEIKAIITKRQPDACADWKAFGEKLSGCEVEDFDVEKYQQDYVQAPKGHKDGTFIGKFCIASMAQKSMVTNKIFISGNMLAGFSVDYAKHGFKGMKDFRELVDNLNRGRENE